MMLASNPPFSLPNILVITLLPKVPIIGFSSVTRADWNGVKRDSLVAGPCGQASRNGRRQ